MEATYTKCLQLQKTPLFHELQEIVKSFAFCNLHEQRKIHQEKMRVVLIEIDQGLSRKNGFIFGEYLEGNQEPDDTNEHWAFGSLTSPISIQAVNCSFCGNYLLISDHDAFLLLDERTICHCHRPLFMSPTLPLHP